MQPGSKGGYFTEKSPKMLLLEWCQQQKRQKPRYKVMAAGAAGMKCKARYGQFCVLIPEHNILTTLLFQQTE